MLVCSDCWIQASRIVFFAGLIGRTAGGKLVSLYLGSEGLHVDESRSYHRVKNLNAISVSPDAKYNHARFFTKRLTHNL